MDHKAEVALLRRLFELRTSRRTSFAPTLRRQPTSAYRDGARHARELECLFRRRPLVAGLSCDLPKPGDYFTVDVADVPALVVRSEDGEVRAFLNACRHRGSPVATGRGTPARVFKCPYHAWAYDIDGRLLGQPLARKAFDTVDRDCLSLVPLAAAEACGLILLTPNQDRADIDVRREFGGLADELASHHFDSFSLVHERTGQWAMNWKQPFETFLESYHFFSLHRDTLAGEIYSTPMLTDTFGPHGRGVLMGRKAPELLERPTSEWQLRGYAHLVYWLFPNTVLSIPRTGHVELWQFYPAQGAIDHTRVTTRFYAPSEPSNDNERDFWRRQVDYVMKIVGDEDFAAQEAILRNINSGLLDELVFGRNEPALVHYHETLTHALAQSDTPPLTSQYTTNHASP
jgi:phenylpropionate dioxygenase-like ring-hydroxylating dioxygenase large terminal subunit